MYSFRVDSRNVHSGAQGALTRANYLFNEQHPNHKKHNTIIEPLHGNPNKVTTKLINEVAEIEAKRFKGGRERQSYAQEFSIAPPSGNTATKEEWQEALKSLLGVLSVKTGVGVRELAKHSYSCIHRQENEHLSLVVAKVVNGKSLSVELTRPSTSNALRRTWNHQCLKMWGLKIEQYKPLNTPTNNPWSDLKVKKKAFEKFKKQLSKWAEAIFTNNEKQKKRQANRIQKTAQEILNNCSPEDFQDFNQVVKIAEDKAGQSLNIKPKKP